MQYEMWLNRCKITVINRKSQLVKYDSRVVFIQFAMAYQLVIIAAFHFQIKILCVIEPVSSKYPLIKLLQVEVVDVWLAR